MKLSLETCVGTRNNRLKIGDDFDYDLDTRYGLRYCYHTRPIYLNERYRVNR